MADFAVLQSGSGGSSRHIYFLCDKPLRSKKLAHSGVKFKGKDGRDHWTWEIELFGTGKQVAVAPSIHPDTGKPYRWLKEPDFETLGIIEADEIASWTGDLSVDVANRDVDGLEYLVGRLDWPHKKLRSVLDGLDHDDFCEDRDGWLRVGMAIHHETMASEEGRQLWHEFSERSGKYDADDLDRVWNSFGDYGSRPVRFVTLVKEAGMLELLHDEPDAPDDQEEAEEHEELAEEGLEVTDTKWMARLDVTDEGAIKVTLYNIRLTLENDPRFKGLARYNEFAQEIYYRTPPGRYVSPKKKIRTRTHQLEGPLFKLENPIDGDLWTDAHDDYIREVFEAPRNRGGYGLKVSDRDIKSAINITARKIPYHPVRETIEQVEWDGVERIDGLAIDYLGCPDDAYHRDTSRLMLIAQIVRIYEPGHKFDNCVILEGKQGVRKSTFISKLGMDWSGELTCGFDNDQKIVEALMNNWTVEMPELSQFAKNEVEPIKAFFSATSNRTRLSYDRRPRDFKRQSVYWGSTNKREYLKDPTGNRRFWPWVVNLEPGEEIDTDRLEAEMPQILAEALAAYREMRAAQPKGTLPLYMKDQRAKRIALQLQQSRQVETEEDALAPDVIDWLDTPVTGAEVKGAPSDFDDLDETEEKMPRQITCAKEIWADCLDYPMDRYERGAALKMTRLMDIVCSRTNWRPVGVQSHPRYGRQKCYGRS